MSGETGQNPGEVPRADQSSAEPTASTAPPTPSAVLRIERERLMGSRDLLAIVRLLVRHPLTGATIGHRSDGASRAAGIMLAIGAALLLPTLHVLRTAITSEFPSPMGILRVYLGGLLGVVFAGVLCCVLRLLIDRARKLEVGDDFWLLGVLLLDWTIAHGLAVPLSLLSDRLGHAVLGLGTIVGAIAHHRGLVSLGQLPDSRALIVTLVVSAILLAAFA